MKIRRRDKGRETPEVLDSSTFVGNEETSIEKTVARFFVTGNALEKVLETFATEIAPALKEFREARESLHQALIKLDEKSLNEKSCDDKSSTPAVCVISTAALPPSYTKANSYHLNEIERDIVRVLVCRSPSSMTLSELALWSGYRTRDKVFKNAIGFLVTYYGLACFTNGRYFASAQAVADFKMKTVSPIEMWMGRLTTKTQVVFDKLTKTKSLRVTSKLDNTLRDALKELRRNGLLVSVSRDSVALNPLLLK